MLQAIVSNSLRQPYLILAAAAALLFFGYRNLRDAPLDVFPEFAPPIVIVQTEAPGLSTEEVERLVTVPLENALNGTLNLKTLRSKSALGVSSIELVFNDGADPTASRQLIAEKISVEAAQLPSVAKPPLILPPVSSTSRVFMIGLRSTKLSQIELSDLARWSIRPALMSATGIANVTLFGQRDREFQVLVDPERLRAHSVSLADVERATGEATMVSSGGYVDTPNQRIPVRHVSPIITAEDLADTVVSFRGGASLRLGDVADIVEAAPPPIGDAVVDDSVGLLLVIDKQPAANTLDVTRQIERKINELKPALGDIQIDWDIFRPATFIEMSLKNLAHSLVIGCVLVALVLAAFLYDWRTAAISATAIPLSLVAAALVLRYVDATLNTMLLAGLVIAIGEVVDDAIIDVENVTRRLRLNRFSPHPRPAISVVLEASLEVRSAVVYGTFTVMLVLMPVFFLEGVAGAFFRPLALAYILAVFTSMIVALTVTPALSLLLLPRQQGGRHTSPLVEFLTRHYRHALTSAIAKPKRIVSISAVIALGCLTTIPFFGEEFLPDLQEYDFLTHWIEKPGTSLAAMDRIVARVGKEIRSDPNVRSFGAAVGRAEAGEDVVGPNFSELWFSLDRDADYDTAIDRVREVLDGYPGIEHGLVTYLHERIEEVLSGTGASIVIRIFGDDLERLRHYAQVVQRDLADVPGIADLTVEQQVQIPQIDVRLKPDAALQFGLTAADVRRAAETLISGRVVGEVFREQKVHQVVVWGVPDVRGDLEAVRRCLIPTPSGGYVPLGDVADVSIVNAPHTISHEDASRRIDVTCNAGDRDLNSVVRDIEDRLHKINFDRGYRSTMLGENVAQQQSRHKIEVLGFVAFIGIVVLLFSEFGSWLPVSLVLYCALFAIVGGIGGIWASGGVLSLGSLVGFVTVVGVAVRNSIMLVSHFRHLEREEGVEPGKELVLRGSSERLSPVLMTALTAILALTPLVIGGNRPGQEIEYPMACVISGGLIASTLVILFVIPSLALWLSDAERVEVYRASDDTVIAP